MSHAEKPRFWEEKSLSELSASEWESLCDHCGKCCVIRLEDEDTGAIYNTDVVCYLFDDQACACTQYSKRKRLVPDCVKLTPDNVSRLHWMPQTCAYRLIYEGKALPDYHHLISGSKETIHEQGMSVRGAVVSEREVPESEQPYRITIWPGEPDIDDIG